MNYLKIKANRTDGYQIAYPYECVCITFFGTVHTPVRGDIAGTITVRPGEYGVVVPNASDDTIKILIETEADSN